MCGIAGSFGIQESIETHRNKVNTLLAEMSHRGPDDTGVASLENGVLGMRRLSIINVSYGGQPVYSHNKEIIVVGNGEIYNHQILRKVLSGKGVVVSEGSDMAIIPELYRHYGVGLFSMLEGMFALAIFDAKNNKVIIARDRLGQKPLYYCHAKTLIFASEIHSIQKVFKSAGSVNNESLARYFLFGRVEADDEFIEGIKTLPSGSILSYDVATNSIDVSKFWSLQKDISLFNQRSKYSTIRSFLISAVSKRLMSDVPLGVFLSGGVDSSLVAAIAQSLHETPLKSFTVGYEDPKYDELSFAREVSKHIGTEFNYAIFTPEEFLKIADTPASFSLPFSDMSMYPTRFVSKLASEHVKVVLTGDGADELFGGYENYQITKFLENKALSKLVGFKDLIKLVSKLLPESYKYKLHAVHLASLVSERVNKFQVLSGINTKDLSRFMSSEIDDRILFKNRLQFSKKNTSIKELTEFVMYMHSNGQLSDLFFQKVDIASMSESIEARSPFADHDLAQAAYSLEMKHKVSCFQSKIILKRIAKDFLPREIIYRRKKGFSSPINTWLESSDIIREYYGDIVSSARFLGEYSILKPDSFRLIFENVSEASNYEIGMLHKAINLDVWTKKKYETT